VIVLISTLPGARLYRCFTDTGFRRILLGLLSASRGKRLFDDLVGAGE
jgi:hypothetical protein